MGAVGFEEDAQGRLGYRARDTGPGARPGTVIDRVEVDMEIAWRSEVSIGNGVSSAGYFFAAPLC
jgi:hypothetical protein